MSQVGPGDIDGVVITEYTRYDDVRGGGIQLFDAERLRTEASQRFAVGSVSVLLNRRGTLRGFHIEPGPGRAKHVSCTVGEVFDVVVDLRPTSPTFGDWAGMALSSSNRRSVFVPPGVGHAILGVSDDSTVTILTDATSASRSEVGVDPFDREIGVDWPEVEQYVRAPRDKEFASLSDMRVPNRSSLSGT